jgi:N-acetylneuraminate synthase
MILIAEIGINHNGSIDIAKQLIASAADAGFDAVKFQKRTINKVYTKEFLDSPRESPWGTTQRHQKEGLEFTKEDYLEIENFCNQLKIKWFASAWDVDAQYFLRVFDLPYNKVASAMLGHKPLLNEIASESRHTFISTGMATLDEIDDVVNIFSKHNCKFELMHCNSTYPMKEEDANLLCIPMLRERYSCNVGYSGHESSLIKVCVTAAALGATSIERHITLDRAMYGSDQAASIETHVLKNFVETIRKIPQIMGNGVKTLSEAEISVRKKLRVDVA